MADKNRKEEKIQIDHTHGTFVKTEKIDENDTENADSPSTSGNSSAQKSKKNPFSRQQYHPYKSTRCKKCGSQESIIHTDKRECTCSESSKLPMKKLEQPSFPCPTCGITFPSLQERSRHIKEHPKRCSFCGMNFHASNDLFTHVSRVHLSRAVDPEPQPAVPAECASAESLYLKDQYVLIPKKPSSQHKEPNSVEQGECSSSAMKKASNANDTSKTHKGNKQPVSGESSTSREQAPEFLRVSNHPQVDNEALFKAICRSINVRGNVDPALKPLASGSLGSNISPTIQNADPSIIGSILQEIQSKLSTPLSIVAPLTINDLNSLISTENACDVISTECLDNSDTPSLNFNSYSHLNWLIDFINKIQTTGYPLKDSTRMKIAHIYSSILRALSMPTGILCMKQNFVCLVEAQKKLSDFLYNHFRCVCDLLS